MIEKLIKKLDDADVLDNTYVFFTTDNGFHISQYRLHPGKECGYDTDIRVPLFVRGPGVARNQSLNIVSSHTDLAPTLLSIAGATRDNFDGLPIPLTGEIDSSARGEHVNVEFWGVGLPEGKFGADTGYYPNNTYKALRLVGQGYSLYYSVWCTGEREYYDLEVCYLFSRLARVPDQHNQTPRTRHQATLLTYFTARPSSANQLLLHLVSSAN